MSSESLMTLIARALTFHIYSLNNKTTDGVKLLGPVAGSFQCSLMKETFSEEPMAGVPSSRVPEISLFSFHPILYLDFLVRRNRRFLFVSWITKVGKRG